uniref:HPr family phosphocarrier protein n=1 Tax=Thaumasiovibrio occultus TaxID=1891184 RepID=UPI000B358073|nr:HPr family phosphocarrier protein [Thaumasiovibrio occultus]
MTRHTQTVHIQNRLGLHARAAIQLVELVQSFDATITLKKEDKEALVEGVMGLLLLESSQGEEITVEAEGPDAEPALKAVCELIAAGFYEE